MNLLLFSLGALTMIVEFSIPRLIAPAYGNTLFSWTAIISIVLFSMTMGYYMGGRLTEKFADIGNLIVKLTIVSVLWTLGIAVFGNTIVEKLAFLDILTGPIITSILFAFVPTLLNAAIVPMVIATRAASSGLASGKCFSVSTIGSIAGVILTGYLLLPILGIKGALFSGCLLVLTALFFSNAKRYSVAVSIIVISCWAWFNQPQHVPGLLVDHSNGYHRLQIIEQGMTEPAKRFLYLDSTIEGVIEKGMISSFLPGVTKLLDEVDNIQSALVIGGGAFAVPRYIKKLFPNARVDVIELDPDVVKYSREYLELDDSVNVLVGDGRNVLNSLNNQYDLIMNDAFRGYKNMPPHLTTIEFNSLVQSRLAKTGIYVVNIRDYPATSYLAASIVLTLGKVFDHLTVIDQNYSNTITVASNQSLSFGTMLPVPEMGFLLTDNRAPTEFLIVADLVRKKLGI